MTVDIGFGGSCFKACTLFLGWLFFWDGYKLGEVFILCHVLQVVFFSPRTWTHIVLPVGF